MVQSTKIERENRVKSTICGGSEMNIEQAKKMQPFIDRDIKKGDKLFYSVKELDFEMNCIATKNQKGDIVECLYYDKRVLEEVKGNLLIQFLTLIPNLSDMLELLRKNGINISFKNDGNKIQWIAIFHEQFNETKDFVYTDVDFKLKTDIQTAVENAVMWCIDNKYIKED